MVSLCRKDASSSPVGNNKNVPGETRLTIDKFPEDVHREVKGWVGLNGISLKSFVVQALQYALKNPSIIEGKESKKAPLSNPEQPHPPES